MSITKQNCLRLSELFYSLQGESVFTGWPTVFIRLTGCPLRCHYCDTAYAFHGGSTFSIDSIMQQVAGFDAQYVTVTGGEPLAQAACGALLTKLCEAGYKTALETSGALSVADVDLRVIKVLDIKTPGSGEVERNLWDNFRYVTAQDQIKFVIVDRADYVWAKQQVLDRNLAKLCAVWFSPSYQQQDATELAQWILSDRLQVRFGHQLHKTLWGETPGK